MKLITRRKAALLIGLAAPALILPKERELLAATDPLAGKFPSSLLTLGTGGPAGTYPGQASNPVGYAFCPASPPVSPTYPNWSAVWEKWADGTSFTATWPGKFPGLTTITGSAIYPGGQTNTNVITNYNVANYAISGSGTQSNPYVIAFLDFPATQGNGFGFSSLPQINVDLQFVVFVGCRFQAQGNSTANVYFNSSSAPPSNFGNGNGAGNINFYYCSFVPNASTQPLPPFPGAWPSAGAGLNIGAWLTPASLYRAYMVPASACYQYCHDIPTGLSGPIQFAFCDHWGFANGSNFEGASTKQVTFQDCYWHDTRNDSGGDHTDGPGYLNGGNGPSNWAFKHCTSAAIGNTNNIAMQGVTNTPINGVIDWCWLGGFGGNVCLFPDQTGMTGMVFTNNIFDVSVALGAPFYHNPSSYVFNSSNPLNHYFNNRINIPPGCLEQPGGSFSFTNANNGNFVWPDSSLNTTDWTQNP